MDEIRYILNQMRSVVNEEKTKGFNEQQNGVPYSRQDELLNMSMKVTKEHFGADFSNIKTPMFYYREDGDVTLSGEIPTLNGAKFQFSYKNYPLGCYFWGGSDALVITDEVIKKISKIYGVYKNWQKELSTTDDIKPMNLKQEEN